MTCEQIRPLLGSHLDEELDVVHDATVVAHLDTCPHCTRELQALTELRRTLQRSPLRRAAPVDLAAQIRRQLAAEPAAHAGRVVRFPRRWSQAFALAASIALAGAIGFQLGRMRSERIGFTDDATASFVRARATGRLYEVASSSQHTVKPWFAGRVDFSPAVPDLAAQGFPLLGGRVERFGTRPAAALVYGRRQHTIDVYVWRDGPAASEAPVREAGFTLLGWKGEDGLFYVAVSDLAAPELMEFRRQFTGVDASLPQ